MRATAKLFLVGLRVALHARCNEIQVCSLLSAGITHKFDSHQLIPASSGFDASSAQKDEAHFPELLRETGVPYSQMLFFDDEAKNIRRVRPNFKSSAEYCLQFIRCRRCGWRSSAT